MKWNLILDSVVTILKYKTIIIYHAIYIKVLYNGPMSYITVSNHDVINTTNNETELLNSEEFLKKFLRLKYKKDMFLCAWIFGVCQSRLSFSVDKTDTIM